MLQLPVYKSDINFNQVLSLDSFSSWVVIKPEYLWLPAVLIGLFFAVASLILSYHWRKFEIDKLVIGQAAILYFSVSTVLVVTMIMSLAVYLNSL